MESRREEENLVGTGKRRVHETDNVTGQSDMCYLLFKINIMFWKNNKHSQEVICVFEERFLITINFLFVVDY